MKTRTGKLAATRWPLIVVALLGGHVLLMMVAVSYALRDAGGNIVIPDYYQKALEWDERRGVSSGSATHPPSRDADPEQWTAPNDAEAGAG